MTCILSAASNSVGNVQRHWTMFLVGVAGNYNILRNFEIHHIFWVSNIRVMTRGTFCKNYKTSYVRTFLCDVNANTTLKEFVYTKLNSYDFQFLWFSVRMKLRAYDMSRDTLLDTKKSFELINPPFNYLLNTCFRGSLVHKQLYFEFL